jgi:serine protease Do
LRVTVGIVSGIQRSFRGPRGRRITGAIEHTSPLLPGSSGGPIVDEAGRVLGINTHRLGEGFYLAIAGDEAARARISSLAAGTIPTRARLGVAIAPPYVARRLRRAVGLPDADGLLVRGVEDDGPAARAGIAEGDLIVRAGGEAIDAVDTLHGVLERAAGGAIDIVVLRGADERTVTVQLAQEA